MTAASDPKTDAIQTPRLTLKLMGQQAVELCIAGDLAGAGRLLGIDISEELLDHPSSLRFTLEQMQTDPLYLPWSARAILLGDTTIGLIRFHSSPNPESLRQYAPDAVEIGYRIFAPYRRQGFAFESVQGLIHWAQTMPGVRNIIAAISPRNLPSLQLADKLAFKKIGETIDEVDGPEWTYLLNIC